MQKCADLITLPVQLACGPPVGSGAAARASSACASLRGAVLIAGCAAFAARSSTVRSVRGNGPGVVRAAAPGVRAALSWSSTWVASARVYVARSTALDALAGAGAAEATDTAGTLRTTAE